MMIKRIVMLLLAVCLFGAVECMGASGKSKKNTTKESRQKDRRSKKNKKNKQQRIAVMLRREFKKIHGLQQDMLRDKGNAEKVKEYSEQLAASLKIVTPHLKQLGNVSGIKFMKDVDKLVAEGRKLASEPDKVSADTALGLLQEHQLEMIEAYRKKVSE